MPHLVHITAENLARRLVRQGIAASRWRPDPEGHPEHDRVVWAFPVLASYVLTHAWSRELKRGGRTALAAITFRLPDGEPVYARHFSGRPQAMTAAAAVGAIRAEADPRGLEIIVPRRISPAEIVGWRPLGRPVGWRYFPTAKGKAPWLCDCPVCLPRGEVKAGRQRERLLERLALAEADRRRRRRWGLG